MPACCDPGEYDDVFTSRYARRTAKSLRTKGLDDIAGRIVDSLSAQGLDRAIVLEIGGGVGGLHSELLRRGATRATNVELSKAYEAEAAALLAESGLTERVTRQITDVVSAPDAVPPADVVVMHRVVCCYPDYAALLGAAAQRATRALALSFPRPWFLTRAQTGLENVGYALQRRRFRTFVHSPEAMLAVLAEHGHVPVSEGKSAMWEFAVTARVSG